MARILCVTLTSWMRSQANKLASRFIRYKEPRPCLCRHTKTTWLVCFAPSLFLSPSLSPPRVPKKSCPPKEYRPVRKWSHPRPCLTYPPRTRLVQPRVYVSCGATTRPGTTDRVNLRGWRHWGNCGHNLHRQAAGFGGSRGIAHAKLSRPN